MKASYKTKWGCIYNADALEYMPNLKDGQINLIMTSPPFGLVRQKDYGNVNADQYLDWFRPFAEQFRRILADDGSLVIDIGGAWIPGQPTRSLYHYELMIMLCREYQFHLAQDFFWWNPSKLPTPAEWVNIRRIRVKDAVNCIWWLSKTPWPKANNRRVLMPYSDSMKGLLKNGYKAKIRPSGHNISEKFSKDNGAAIPPNLLAIANTESNSSYMLKCKQARIKPHPARFPVDLPEYFIRLLSDKKDMILDPFAGSCATGEAAEKMERHWICVELDKNYVNGGQMRFPIKTVERKVPSYKLFHPGVLWNKKNENPSLLDGGQKRFIHS